MNRWQLATACRGCVFVAATLLVVTNGAVLAQGGARPNIILIMSDDMGFSDIGCYGSEIETPTLDRLAENGLRFTQFYNTARCCPTRACLLTGLYPHQAGIGHMTSDRGYDGYRGDLNEHCVTIAEVLRPAGYRTYMVGKWHVTKGMQPDGPKDNWPLQRGFERFYGMVTGAGSFYDPATLTRDNTMITPENDPVYRPERYYFSHAVSDNATMFLREHFEGGGQEPFFMYVAYTAAHWPMHALPEDIAKYRGRYDEGYGAIREARLARMRQMGLVDPKWEMSPQAESWDAVENKAWESRCMEVYAAMVDSMDQGIGRIVATLEEADELNNTLIMFFQDNGGCAEGMGRRPDRELPERRAPMAKDEVQLSIAPDFTRDGRPVRHGPPNMPGPDDTYIAYGRGWANVSNTPFREYKHWVHEGGIATPLVVHWPTGVDRRGQLEHVPSHLIDIMATCVDVAQADYPTSRDGAPIYPMEGRSLVPALQGEDLQRDAIYWEHEGNRAVRIGDWKLVAKGAKGPWELYHLGADRSELHDRAEEMPAMVEAMAAKWRAWAQRAHVLPLNPRQSEPVTFSEKKRFQLKQGDDLDRTKAPFVEGKEITVRLAASVTSGDAWSGVLLAQGGSSQGYALYLAEGDLVFAVRRNGKISAVRLPVAEVLPSEGKAQFEAVLRDGGAVELSAKGSKTKRQTGKVAGLMVEMPLDGLQVGSDETGQVGDYGDANPFEGRIEGAVVEVAP